MARQLPAGRAGRRRHRAGDRARRRPGARRGARPLPVRRPIEWVPLPVGAAAIETHGSALPPITLETLEQARRLAARSARQRVVPGGASRAAEPERLPPQALRPVREHPAGEGLRGDARAGARARPGRRPGEHRGLLRRSQYLSRHRRVHADRGRGDRDGHLHPAGDRADRPAGVRAGDAAPQAPDHRAQGERAARPRPASSWTSAARSPPSTPTSRSTTSTSTR